jgi:hypothetical protein
MMETNEIIHCALAGLLLLQFTYGAYETYQWNKVFASMADSLHRMLDTNENALRTLQDLNDMLASQKQVIQQQQETIDRYVSIYGEI